MKKDFKYQVRTREAGKLIVEEIVTFGTESKPFPDDWKNSGVAISALEEYKESMIQNHFEISYKEFNESEEVEEMDKIYHSKDCIDFAIWLRENDTQENAEKFFHFSNQDMFDYWLENLKNKYEKR